MARRYRLHLHRYVSPTTRRTLASGTQSSYLIALRSLLRFLARSGADAMPADRIELGKGAAAA